MMQDKKSLSSPFARLNAQELGHEGPPQAPRIGDALSAHEAMTYALQLAEAAALEGEVPVGAVVLDGHQRFCTGRSNAVERLKDPSAHAEILALRETAALLKQKYLKECQLFVTLEPCPMCAAAIVHFKLGRLIFGAYDPKGGGVEHGPRIFEQKTCLHRPEVIGGVNSVACGALLTQFFSARR